MKVLALGLVAALAVALAGDAALAQARDGGRVGGQGSYADVRGGPGTGGEYRGVPSGGYHRGGYPIGSHAGYSARWYGGYGGWYGPGVGIYFGGPAYWGGWSYPIYGAYPRYYPYSYAYPYPLYVPAEPTVYVEQSPQAVPATNYWYYCPDPAGYFPYVQSCSKAWMTVVPSRGPNPPSIAAPSQ